ncbi:archaellin/type IV pilin N-terminal domain-containing protein [Halorubrum sp. AD140]|uniref:archaellin/type IV pilin N-terminal domain-containing protein n=1 Tax=Halorubrum sp. AD140 TaxID=3050073 RepID=UPI002ACCFE17|nr:archaellin/type IV pilin N-terminal domain-containing protein [Halorubrum sp. AD140]MDZ5811063.1 archaellin/type IV pilin N-terminal domain-containing protein [Halorubrum sp. AD140]
MFETIQNEEERGQVGIGTLIVFIAMVLVAAIAAGVLINTAGFLQTQAEATGEESTSQVSDRLQIVSQSGNVTDDGDSREIDNISLTVAQSPGSDNIDLNETTVELVGTGGQETTELNEDMIDIFTEDEDGAVVLTDSSERANIELELDGDDIEYGNLSGGDQLSVTFTTPSGATTSADLRVPTTLTDEEDSVRL